MSVNNAPASHEIVGKNNQATNLVVTMDGINTFSAISSISYTLRLTRAG
jgi:hypothetical protein